MVSLDGESPTLMGFYVNQSVEAAHIEAAKGMVFDDIRNDEFLNSLIVDSGQSNPSITLETISELDNRPKNISVEFGEKPRDINWHFFPMSET